MAAAAAAAAVVEELPVEFEFAQGFDAGVGAVRAQNEAILGYASSLAYQINQIRYIRGRMNGGYIMRFFKEALRLEGVLRQMREGQSGILLDIVKVCQLGGVPVLIPVVIEQAMMEILGPVQLTPGVAALAALAGSPAAAAGVPGVPVMPA